MRAKLFTQGEVEKQECINSPDGSVSCSGDACMAWVWVQTQEYAGSVMNKITYKGFFGRVKKKKVWAPPEGKGWKLSPDSYLSAARGVSRALFTYRRTMHQDKWLGRCGLIGGAP